MILISFLGIDQFVVGHYSKEHTANLAQLFEVPEDEISFFAPNAMIFHNGVEQTSWSILITVRCDHKYEPLQEAVAGYLFRTIKDFAIHIEIHFDYIEAEHTMKLVNDDYPAFIEESNIVNYDDDDEDGHDHDHEDDEEDEEVYLGDVFESVSEELKTSGEDE